MSQNNGRRLTVAQDGYSGIPHPSSVLKKRAAPDYFAAPPPPSRPGRVSMAPVAGGPRSQLGQSLSQSSTHPHAPSGNTLRMSMLRPPPAPVAQSSSGMASSRGVNHNPYGKTPLRNPSASVRKQTANYGASRMSVAPSFSQGAMAVKDTRPIRDKSFQLMCANEDFQTIFIFLINDVIDPNFQWGRAGRKMEDDIILLLKDHRYRSADTISKSSLAAVGSMHAWPNVLAMLHWLVNLSLLKLRFMDSMAENDPWLPAPVDPDGKPSSECEPDAVIDDYIAATYKLYLSGEDQFPEQLQVLEDFFDRRSEAANVQVENDTIASNRATSELQTLLAKPTELAQAKAALEEAQRLKEQYTTGIETTQRKDAKLVKNIQALKENVEEAKAALQAAIAAQPITAEEMQRLATETEKLQRNLREMQTRHRDLVRQNNSSEVALSHRVHQLDNAVTEYNETLWKLGLLHQRRAKGPNDSMESNGEEDAEGEYEIELNSAANVVGEMLRGGGTLNGGLKHRVQPALSALADDAREARTELDSERLAKESEVDKIAEEIEHIGDETDMLRRKIDMMQDKAEEVKNASALVLGELREEIERLERDLANVGVGAQSALVNAQTRLGAAEAEFQDITYKSEQLKKQTYEEIMKHTTQLLEFREQIGVTLIFHELGAITVQLPAGLTDASDLRQVPDTQEVFLAADSDVSIVCEILERVAPDDPVEVAKFHFDSLSHDNDAVSSTVEIVNTPAQQPVSTSPIKLSILQGTQLVPKFNRTHPDTVKILLAVYRVVDKSIDLVLTFNVPVQAEKESSAVDAEGAKRWTDAYEAAVSSLKIVDFGLFA
ncbi:Ran-interacting Mog1 protein [Rhizoctonia solani]|uniref:Ran-interacting Mog1 protein n=1 Tax=Rhizoctonia solani TaxID=456999 RepID=A0A8H7M8Q6_9AGAM|nr:Ran-interacting Mog1 protein [Rhizoctonia solani]